MTILSSLVRTSLVLALPLAGCFACGSDDTKDPGELTVEGALTNGAAPAKAKVVVIWDVSSGSPDYTYKFGEGASTGARYLVSPTTEPPKEAINSYGIGIGFLTLVPEGTTIPDGKVNLDTLSILGISKQHAIIWRAADANTAGGVMWGADFPAGYSCGACVAAPEGEVFDSYEPVDCSKVAIDIGESDGGFCNWT
jgi:hypothetical protein